MLQNYKRFILPVALVVLLLIGFLVYQSLQFRITGTTPNHNKFPASLSNIEIRFSHELDKPALEDRIASNISDVVTVDFESTIRATVDGKKLTLNFSQTPNVGLYNITLKNIPAASGKTLSTTLKLNVKDIPYDELSDEEKAQFDKEARNFEDDEVHEFPLIRKLPYETDKYLINIEHDHNDPAPIITITMKFFEPGSNAAPATPAEKEVYLNELRKYRNEALAWLRSQSSTLEEDYSLRYTELDLQSEFPSGRGRYFEGADDSHSHDDE